MTPVQRVLLGAAGKEAKNAAWVFALDNECAHIARVVREPMMGQIRLAWWRDALSSPTPMPEHRSDMVDALRALDRFDQMRPHLIALVDAWEELIVGASDGADAFARGRGAGLFAALAPGGGAGASLAGTLWALWDLAGKVDDEELAAAALSSARKMAGTVRAVIPALPRMLAMMATVACNDVEQGKGAPRSLTPRLYWRLLRSQFFRV